MTEIEFIRKCDTDFSERLYLVADKVGSAFSNNGSVKIISLSGPTCSGKTTAAGLLSQRLGGYGISVLTVSIDDFYFDRDYLHALATYKGTGKIDYDSVDTIDLDSLKKFIVEICATGRAECPIFDFKTGRRSGMKTLTADKGTVLLFEGIQAIYPEIRALFGSFGLVSIYICPQTPVSDGGEVFLPDEIRLLRRIVRDSNFRGADVGFTLTLWESVRHNEELNIFPYVSDCDFRIDSTHAYEIRVLKPYLERLLPTFGEDSPHKAAAERILQRIASVTPIDSSLIPQNSLYKEFV